MRRVFVVTHYQEFKTQAPDKEVEVHTCMKCVAMEKNITEAEAKTLVLGIPIAHKKRRFANLQEGKALATTKIAAMPACNRKQRRELTKECMIELFGPLAKHVVRKIAAVAKFRKDIERHAQLVAKLKDCKDIEAEQEILTEMELLEVSDGWLAFQGKVDQHSYIMAASYSDQWTEIKDQNGRTTGGVMSWSICQANSGTWDYEKNRTTPCYRITASKDWDKRHSDPLATKQRWYCSCGTRFKATWGQIVETSTLNPQTMKVEKCYMKSDVPNWDHQDIRAMALEEELAPTSARELYEKVETVNVALGDFIVQDEQGFHRIANITVFLNITVSCPLNVSTMGSANLPA